MSKLIIRFTILLVAVYLILCYLVSYIFLLDIWRQIFYLLFELCVCLCISAQGVYHCKYIKWTAYAILTQDTLVCSDVLFDYMPDNIMAAAPPAIILVGLTVTTTLAVQHYIKVKRIKKIWRVNHPY